MRKLIFFLVIFVALAAIGWFVMMFLTKHIYTRTDCERFNIDNIELRANIDIPAIEGSDLECESDGTTKNSFFKLDKNALILDDYIQENKFVKEGALYVNQGEREDTKWRAELDPETYQLSVTIVYKK